MHDPMTVAFELGGLRFWLRKRRTRPHLWDLKSSGRYIDPLITIWHVDPEVGGDDDSCGFTFPNVSPEMPLVQKLVEDLRFECREDARALHKQRASEGRPMWWLLWLERASFWHRGRGLSSRQVAKELHWWSFPGTRRHDPSDSFLSSATFEQIAMSIARGYLHLARPWYRKPRWHVHHWEFQIHPLQKFKRWAFSRCSKCGKRFTWGYCPVTGSWSGKGPRWFRSEPNIWHSECDRPQLQAEIRA